VSSVPSLPAGTLTIDDTGKIIVDVSAVGHAYLGSYAVTVRVAHTATNYIELPFTLKIDQCVVTDLTLKAPYISDKIYTIAEPPI